MRDTWPSERGLKWDLGGKGHSRLGAWKVSLRGSLG